MALVTRGTLQRMDRFISNDYELVPITKLRTHPRNARRGDLDAIKRSLTAFGFYGTLTVQRSTGSILKGNHTFMAAVELGWTELPVTWADVNDADALDILIVDNRTAQLGSYDDAALADLLRDAQDRGTLDSLAYSEIELAAIIAASAPPTFEPSTEVPPRLDELAPKQQVTCPNCWHDFTP